MDVATAATYFDAQPVYDAYAPFSLLFYGQPDLYDSTERDSTTGFRRTVSANPVVVPARGCVTIASEPFIVGRTISDYFDGEVIRQHLLLHPADGLFAGGSADKFLTVPIDPTLFYAGISWVRDRRVEETTARAYPVYDIYCSTAESVAVGWVIKDHTGQYHRVEAMSFRTGGLQAALAYALGTTALRSITYTPTGSTYDPFTGTYASSTPVTDVKAIAEGYWSNYHLITNAATGFEPADMIYTVLKSVVNDPKPNELITDGRQYRILSRRDDGLVWILHVRPV